MEAFGIDVTINIDNSLLTDKLDSLLDDETMLAIHNLFAKMCDPYVPMDEGVLSQTLEITPQSVRYTAPYAHYMYVGEVYGPNIPIKDESGEIVGWFSIPGRTKTPTGRPINYNTDKHPLATREWDKAMLRDRGDDFMKQIEVLLIMKARELYG